jgi:hypothetical protein
MPVQFSKQVGILDKLPGSSTARLSPLGCIPLLTPAKEAARCRVPSLPSWRRWLGFAAVAEILGNVIRDSLHIPNGLAVVDEPKGRMPLLEPACEPCPELLVQSIAVKVGTDDLMLVRFLLSEMLPLVDLQLEVVVVLAVLRANVAVDLTHLPLDLSPTRFRQWRGE